MPRALFEQRCRFGGREVCEERQTCGKLGVFCGRRANQRTEPAEKFRASCLGRRVNGAFGMPSVPLCFLWHNQPLAQQRLDDGVQRAIVELDAISKPPLAHHGRNLVRMHGSLGEQGQNGQRQEVGDLAFCHGHVSFHEYLISYILNNIYHLKYPLSRSEGYLYGLRQQNIGIYNLDFRTERSNPARSTWRSELKGDSRRKVISVLLSNTEIIDEKCSKYCPLTQ